MIIFSEIESDGYSTCHIGITRTSLSYANYLELNVKEIRPPQMDDSGRTKYPVLFRVYVTYEGYTTGELTSSCRYGGPNSQLVNMMFSREWDHYVACDLQYIVVIVDGRGTGFKGRKLRNPVKSNLGFWETRDQVNAARSVTSD